MSPFAAVTGYWCMKVTLMGSAEVLAAPTDKVQFMEDMKNEVRKQTHS